MSATAFKERSFDPDALREKYRKERDKRIRSDGNEQYTEVTGDFSHYVDDPYVDPGFERSAVECTVEVLIIGGGFGGMLAAARLRDQGINNLMIVEKGGGALAVLGTGTAIPVHLVISSRWCICRYLKRPDLSPNRNTPMPVKRWSTVRSLLISTNSTTSPSCRRRF
ncbi:FAD-binding protein [Luminiphilus sp.]|nr:FAD-binding protein [Luminiphilus sp.]